VGSSLAQAFVRQLEAWGVKAVYGVTGDDILPFLDALAREGGDIRYIGAAHEAGASFMASYEAKLTGGLGVCVASAAGAVNLAQGLADAFLDGAPVLALTGQAATSLIGTQTKQYFDQQALIKNFAVYSQPVTSAAAGPRLLTRAMTQALTRKSVAHLSIPADLWSAEAGPVEPGGMPALAAPPLRQVSGDIERAAGIMRRARKPLVVVGSAGRTAVREIRQVVDTWRAAVVVAQEAKGAVPDTWPGVLGGIGEAWTPPLLAEADCILLIGRASFEEQFLPRAPVIQVESRPWRVDERFLWDSLAGDIPYITGILADRIRGYEPDPSWMERVAAAAAERLKISAADAQDDGRPVHPARLMAALSRSAAGDAFILVDEGAFNHWFDRDFQSAGRTVLLSSRWRSMGAALPGAIAVQVRRPQRQVIALVGDGGLLMSMGEMATAVKYGLPVKVVVANNGVYGLEVDKTLAGGYRPLGLETASPDFASCARAFGFHGFKVDDPERLEETLREAFSLAGPALVDVACRDVRLPCLK